MSKVVIGSAAVGAAILVAYQTGYVDQILGRKEHHDSPKAAKIGDEKVDIKDVQHSEDKSVFPITEDPNKLPSTNKQAEKVETLSDVLPVEVYVKNKMKSRLRCKINWTQNPGKVLSITKRKIYWLILKAAVHLLIKFPILEYHMKGVLI